MPQRSQVRLFAQLLEQYEPNIRRAFMAGVADLYANVDWKALISALQAQDLNAAVNALNISADAWNEYAAMKSEVYARAGAATAAQITQAGIAGIGVRFQLTNPEAQRWISENIGDMITRITREQVENVRTVIADGFSKGEHPHTIARDIVGRVNRISGKREGGVLGLDGPRAERLHAVTVGMRTKEGVQDLVIRHQDGSLSVRYKVNKSTETRIIKAYRDGTAVSLQDRIISEQQYRNALLKSRGDTIARTETSSAVMGARDEQWRQLTEQGIVQPELIIKTWRHRRGRGDFRPDHVAMSGVQVRGLNTPFVFPDGTAMQYPCDPSAAAKHVINCGCEAVYTVDHARAL